MGARVSGRTTERRWPVFVAWIAHERRALHGAVRTIATAGPGRANTRLVAAERRRAAIPGPGGTTNGTKLAGESRSGNSRPHRCNLTDMYRGRPRPHRPTTGVTVVLAAARSTPGADTPSPARSRRGRNRRSVRTGGGPALTGSLTTRRDRGRVRPHRPQRSAPAPVTAPAPAAVPGRLWVQLCSALR